MTTMQKSKWLNQSEGERAKNGPLPPRPHPLTEGVRHGEVTRYGAEHTKP